MAFALARQDGEAAMLLACAYKSHMFVRDLRLCRASLPCRPKWVHQSFAAYASKAYSQEMP